ncbi:MAG: DEAD/DEAH box helicase [Bdellovibrionales bacterium]|nr:DEAD/DEAH box helicase [Bdellovibrionales bacterium]
MIQTTSEQAEKLLEFIKKRAPFSIVDLGLSYAADGNVLECSMTGNVITGLVKNRHEETHTVTLRVLSGHEIEATSTASSTEELEEQWDPETIAVLWRSSELNFLEDESGFASTESTYRMNTSSSEEIAAVIQEVSEPGNSVKHQSNYFPNVKIALDLNSDRLGVKVFFDKDLQAATLFGGFQRKSARSLDNVLLQLLEDEGTWDESSEIWYVNSSSSIDLVLGLIEEYKDVYALDNKKQVKIDHSLLEAKVTVEWLDSGAELVLYWIPEDQSAVLKEGDLLGTGPYWTIINNVIYKLSPAAARLASIFPYASRITLNRSQIAPILEQIHTELFNPNYLEVLNAKNQPEAKIRKPKPQLDLQVRQSEQSHFSSGDEYKVSGSLDFIYPQPPKDQNVVYLPNREAENEHIDFLRARGFSVDTAKNRFEISGDAALGIVEEGIAAFPPPWKILGLDRVKSSTKTAELVINVSMTVSKDQDSTAKEDKLDWFDCKISLIQNNANVPLSSLFKNTMANSDQWIRLDSGAYARVPGGGLKQLSTMLGMLDPNYKLSNTIKTKLNTAQAISLSKIEDKRFIVELDQQLKTLAKKLGNFASIEKIKISKNFCGNLRIYQEEGLSWLNFLREFRLGGILADEMGLGKTVQTLALIQYLKDSRAKGKKLSKPVLVVAPTSVITNWLYEARKFAPKLKTLLLHGPARKAKFVEIPEHDIVITSYALLRIDRYELERYQFSYIILDEAQNIKNPQAATTKAAKSLKADFRLALTGTPTENRPMELWSIMDFLMPGYLGTSEFFRNNIERPILEEDRGAKVAKLLNSRTKPFILRRSKSEVEKELPPKIESELHVEMEASQAELYSQILEEVRPKVFDAVEKKGVQGASVSILAALLRLRQVCNHPNSIDAFKDLDGYESGKFNALKDLVTEALDNGRKILLFSQFRGMLALIRSWLDEHDVNYRYLDGATKNRQNLVDEFNNDEKVKLFLISLKAGGTGLNLTAADTVIIYDPWWNPAVEAQAVDRAHRIGQSKKVSVYRLVTENSIEQKIMTLKAKKSQLVEALLDDQGISPLNLTKEDLENLFTPISV